MKFCGFSVKKKTKMRRKEKNRQRRKCAQHAILILSNCHKFPIRIVFFFNEKMSITFKIWMI